LRGLPPATLKFIPPMLAKPSVFLPEGENWMYEIKLDGYRALVVKKQSEVHLFSRRGNKLKERFPSIAKSFSFLPANTTIDGEIVAIDDQGRISFTALQNSQSRPAQLYFYAFDLLALRGKDVRRLKLGQRRSLLHDEVLSEAQDPVRLSANFDAPPRDLIAAATKQGLEGIVAKRVDSVYESGERSGAWLKYKTNKGQELVIAGYKPGPTAFEYLLAGYYEGRDLIFIAKIKNGFTPALRRQVAAQFKGLGTRVCPFANLPEPRNARRGEALTAEVMKQMCWLKPGLVAQIEFTEWTTSNHLRHSRFVALRDDKNAREVVHEQ
jgi:bifunctional non-homologous end joining protein LigD